MANKSITIRPRDGGRLASGVSVDSAGLADYSIKRNFRRTLDGERRREGYDYLWANTSDDEGKTFSTNPGDQPFPGRAALVNIYATTFRGSDMKGFADLVSGQAHLFQVGEKVRVSYGNVLPDGVYTVLDVREDVCRTRLTLDLSGTHWTASDYYSQTSGDATVSLGSIWSEEPITMVHMATRPNGRKALIVGTRPRLYRFLALDETGYVDPAAEYIDTGDANFPYWDGNPGEWVVIANGFSMNAQRWEAVSINGWSIFNNGVDLPHSFRVEEAEAYPLYELREQGIASVGCIAEYGGTLFCGNIKEIKTNYLDVLFTPDGVDYSPRSVASQSGTTVTLSNDCGFVFEATDVGRVIIYSTGEQAEITAYVSETQVTVDTEHTIDRVGFKVYCQASQSGSTRSGGITMTKITNMIIASGPIFDASMVGDKIRTLDGKTFEITIYVSPTMARVDTFGDNITDPILFSIIHTNVSDRVVTGCDLFTSCMVGRFLVWENTGHVRRITRYISPTEVEVSQYGSIPEGPFYIENQTSYSKFDDSAQTNQISWRVLWSDYEKPTKFYPSVACEISVGSRDLKLKVPSKAFQAGDSILIAGAGENGGNLTATVKYIVADRFVRIDTEAKSTTFAGVVQHSDATGSIVGFEDIQDDSSGVIKMLELESTLVIYKDTSIFLVNQSTSNEAPYVFRLRKIPKSHSLYYRNTLVLVDGKYHLYAGKNSFYRFDLSLQRPVEDALLELCKDTFYNDASLVATNDVWASPNAVTKEVFITAGGSGADPVICFDYLYGTASTADIYASAAASVKRPKGSALTGETEDWFVIGTAEGVVLVYGKAIEPVESWSDAEEIFYRRSAYPFASTKESYDSLLRSGMGDFGSSYVHKILRAIQVQLSSRSGLHPVKVMPLGAESPSGVVTQLMASHFELDKPETTNRVNLYFRRYLFGDEIKVEGQGNPVELVGKTYEYTAERTNGTNMTAKVT